METVIFHSDEEIQDLLECEKVIVNKPPKAKESNRDMKRKFDVISVDGAYKFEVFFAQNSRLPRDFSIGIMLDKYLLVRFNGFHGTTIAGFLQYGHHERVHSHTLTLNDVANGREAKPSKIADMTGNYNDFESAQWYFLRTCGIINYKDYFNFSHLEQMSIDDWMHKKEG